MAVGTRGRRPGTGGGQRSGAGRGRRADRTLRPRRTFLPLPATLLKITLSAVLIATATALLWLPDAEAPPTGATAAPAPATSAPAMASSAPASPATAPADWAPAKQSPPGEAGQPSPPARPGTASKLPAGTVGVPVRVAEPAALAVIRPGARVDLMLVPVPGTAPPPTPPPPTLLAPLALVLDVVDPAALDGGGALYLALTPEQAQRVVVAPPDARFAVVIRS